MFPTKTALIAALDEEIIAETLTKFSEAKLREEKLQKASQNEPAGPRQDNDWVDRRLRVLERAIELLETRIETVSVEQSRLSAAHAEIGARQMTATPPVMAQAPRPVEPPPVMATDKPGELVVEIPAHEPRAPQILEDYVFQPRPVEPKVIRDMLDNARTLVNSASGSVPKTSDQRNTKLVLIGAAALVLVGMIIGVVSVGDAARATQTSDPADTKASIKAAGVTVINATGGMVPEQMTPATKTLTARAEKGDATAQADLAMAYLRGDGVVSNPAAAAGWAGLSATKGHAQGQFLLGTIYNSGIKPDPHTGFRWMSAAALNGNVKAMHNVAVAFVIGSGIEKNPTEAANWFGKAAAKGYRDSAFDLAVLYERGEGVAQSTQRALYWYDRAAAAGDKEAAQRAALLRFSAAELAGNLETSQDLTSRLQ
jgi:hypothetical protein